MSNFFFPFLNVAQGAFCAATDSPPCLKGNIIDYRRLDIPVERLDEIALARLESMCPCIMIVDGDGE